MGSLIGKIDHLSGAKQGNIPGNSGEPSRIGQGTGVPKTVSGNKSYTVRHPTVKPVAAIDTKVASSSGKLPSVPKASKVPKLNNLL